MEMTTTFPAPLRPGATTTETVRFDDGTRRLLEVTTTAGGHQVDRFFRGEINGEPYAIGSAGEGPMVDALAALTAIEVPAA